MYEDIPNAVSMILHSLNFIFIVTVSVQPERYREFSRELYKRHSQMLRYPFAVAVSKFDYVGAFNDSWIQLWDVPEWAAYN